MASSSSDSAALPPPFDISRHFSEATKRRNASEVKRFYKYFQIPGIGQLAGGLPYHNYFPFDTLEASSAKPDRWQPTPNDPVKPPSSRTGSQGIADPVNPKAAQIVVPRETGEKDPLRKIDIKTALQYGQAQGYPALLTWIRSFTTKQLHPNVLYEGGLGVTLSCGNTDGFCKVTEALSNLWVEGINPREDREGILCDEFAYMNAVQASQARGLDIVPVTVDGDGMMTEGDGGLESVLTNWDTSRGKRPHLMYTVSLGQNPTGYLLSMDRRKKIYEICVTYDVVIIEDEPYWYLQYPSADKQRAFTPEKGQKSSGYEFLDSLMPSYISLDYEGRVVRLDTFSKTVAPGCRLGWVTAQPALIERVERIAETSSAAPSGFVQSIIAELVMGPNGKKSEADQQDGWGVDGWVRWLQGLRGNYERRMNTMCDILDEGTHLVKTGRRPSLSQLSLQDEDEWGVVESKEVYRYQRPHGGMFVWIEILYHTHPLAKHFSGVEMATALWVHLTRKPFLVLVAPGTIFAPTPEIGRDSGWRYFRLSYVCDEEELVTRSTTGFVQGIAAFWRIKEESVIQKLLDDAQGEGTSMETAGRELWGTPNFF